MSAYLQVKFVKQLYSTAFITIQKSIFSICVSTSSLLGTYKIYVKGLRQGLDYLFLPLQPEKNKGKQEFKEG